MTIKFEQSVLLLKSSLYYFVLTECDSDEESHSPIRNDVAEYMNSFRDDELISICLKPYGCVFQHKVHLYTTL